MSPLAGGLLSVMWKSKDRLKREQFAPECMVQMDFVEAGVKDCLKAVNLCVFFISWSSTSTNELILGYDITTTAYKTQKWCKLLVIYSFYSFTQLKQLVDLWHWTMKLYESVPQQLFCPPKQLLLGFWSELPCTDVMSKGSVNDHSKKGIDLWTNKGLTKACIDFYKSSIPLTFDDGSFLGISFSRPLWPLCLCVHMVFCLPVSMWLGCICV